MTSGGADAGVHYPTREQSTEVGHEARRRALRESHAQWDASSDRTDPLGLIQGQNITRLPWLVPLRHARMSVSAFAFFRGAAIVMANDLAGSPTSGLTVQLGGDAHLANFVAYASPDRRLVFDANDFDETMRGPWEWDLKRLAVSVQIAGRHLGLDPTDTRRATHRVVRSYCSAMADHAGEGYVATWHRSQQVDDVSAPSGISQDELDRRLARFERHAKRRSNLQAVGKLTESVGGRRVIRHQPPVLVPLRSLPAEFGDASDYQRSASEAVEQYRTTLNDARRFLLDRYELVDVGVKVVGVGSVGTRCLVLLLRGRDESDLLLLQAKEASASVLEPLLGATPYQNHGRRVVEGQRLVQAQSDIFLGWTEGAADHRQFYVRQLRDWKGSLEIDGATADQLAFYADLCGRTLARGHARTGDPAAIRAYTGGGRTFGNAILAYSESYAEQNDRDHQRFVDAIGSGEIEASSPH